MEQPAVWNKRGINFNNIQIVPEQKYVDTIQILQRWYTFMSDILCSTKNGLQFIKLISTANILFPALLVSVEDLKVCNTSSSLVLTKRLPEKDTYWPIYAVTRLKISCTAKQTYHSRQMKPFSCKYRISSLSLEDLCSIPSLSHQFCCPM